MVLDRSYLKEDGFILSYSIIWFIPLWWRRHGNAPNSGELKACDKGFSHHDRAGSRKRPETEVGIGSKGHHRSPVMYCKQ